MKELRPVLIMSLLLVFGTIVAAQVLPGPGDSAIAGKVAPEQAPSKDLVVTLTTQEWPPYVGAHLPNGGYVHELVVNALGRAGYRAKVRIAPWARAMREAQFGEVDAIFPAYYSESRSRQLAFSDPFPGGPVGLYKRSDSSVGYPVDPRANPAAALKGLQEYTIGVVRGYVNTQVFDQADFLKKEPVASDTINLRRLYYHRVDLVVIDKFVADYLLNNDLKAYRSDLEFMHPPLEIKYLYVAFSKQDPDHQEKLEAFNRGLALMKKDGSLQRIYEKHGVEAVLEYEKQLSLTGVQDESPVE